MTEEGERKKRKQQGGKRTVDEKKEQKKEEKRKRKREARQRSCRAVVRLQSERGFLCVGKVAYRL